MYLKAKGYNIQSVYLKHDWVFPDIEEYIMRYSDVVVEVDRSLSDVLQKRGWPSMRGGNKQWHTRELELCVDKYLRETQSTEILCFDADISKSALKIRQKRKTPFCLPLYSESLSINDYTVSTCLVLPELRDQSETHYLIPIKGLMYSSLRPKFELEMFYMMNIEYKQRYETVRNMKSIEGVWDRLLELDDSIESDIKLFSGYSTLLDLLYEFDGRNLSRMIEEYEEYPTGRFITLHEQRVKTIQRAITEQNWLWALDHRSKQRWYTVKPIEFSKSQKTVRVITKDGMKHEKFLPVTNLYNRPAENYNGSL